MPAIWAFKNEIGIQMTRTIDRIKTGRFLKRADLMDSPMTVTIHNVIEEDVARGGEPEKLKHVVYFHETTKALVLGLTNARLISDAVGSDDMDLWPEKQIVLFFDPEVYWDGERVGGVRAKAVGE